MTQPYIPTRANDPHGLFWFETRPRHLAGGGDPRRITQTLRAAGWHNLSDPDFPHVVLASPDRRHSLVLEPRPGPYGRWWRIRGQQEQGSWYSEFGAHTPVEILAALTDALLEPAPDHSPDIWPQLTAAGWHYQRDEHGNEDACHPDGRLHLRRFSDKALGFHWLAEATFGEPHERVWRAWLDDRMPRHLLAAFAKALASDEPVQRSRGDVPHLHLVTQEERGPQAEQLAAEHEARLKAVGAAARRARRTAARSTPGAPPAPAPSSRPAARR
ncbi:DUF317 domain-containing protein [Streptomyces sp. NPDC051132]|uniref:DUF317 domain-containing protein n=1 Tax=unclassified Streptomyces TaxID=2593676 RepID=UPI00341862E2